jgi:hypothetical protein
MDTFFPSPSAQHGKPVPAPAGLALLGTAPLTAKERETLRHLARVHRMMADSLEDAMHSNRADLALEACAKAGVLGELNARAAAAIGAGGK